MKGGYIRYGTRFGCRFGMPHDMMQLKDTNAYKVDKCRICGVRKKWNKGFKGRVDNPEYLKMHVRQFAQKTGPTRRVYAKIYKRENTVIHIA